MTSRINPAGDTLTFAVVTLTAVLVGEATVPLLLLWLSRQFEFELPGWSIWAGYAVAPALAAGLLAFGRHSAGVARKASTARWKASPSTQPRSSATAPGATSSST